MGHIRLILCDKGRDEQDVRMKGMLGIKKFEKV